MSNADENAGDVIVVKYVNDEKMLASLIPAVSHWRRMVPSLLPAMAVILFFTLQDVKGWSNWRSLLPTLGFLFFITFFFKRWIGRQTCRNFMKSPLWGQSVVWRITREGLKSEIGEGGSLAGTDLKWGGVTRVVETQSGFMVHIKRTTFHWLPLHGFQDADAVEKFRAFVKAQGVKMARW